MYSVIFATIIAAYGAEESPRYASVHGSGALTPVVSCRSDHAGEVMTKREHYAEVYLGLGEAVDHPRQARPKLMHCGHDVPALIDEPKLQTPGRRPLGLGSRQEPSDNLVDRAVLRGAPLKISQT
jgi:hypothetical protein